MCLSTSLLLQNTPLVLPPPLSSLLPCPGCKEAVISSIYKQGGSKVRTSVWLQQAGGALITAFVQFVVGILVAKQMVIRKRTGPRYLLNEGLKK